MITKHVVVHGYEITEHVDKMNGEVEEVCVSPGNAAFNVSVDVEKAFSAFVDIAMTLPNIGAAKAVGEETIADRAKLITSF
ncbi:MAG: hypothetical protein WC797_00250 [Candidatus Paceibacterota bacterium]|jgi:hypothetical protein